MQTPEKREVKYSDPNMEHEGVLFYRETFDKCPNRGFRADIVATVKTSDDLCLWQDVLTRWGYMKNGKWKPRNPLDIKGMLTVFEYRVRERERLEEPNRNNEAAALHSRGGAGIPERSDSNVSKVSCQPPSIYFRTS